ncbi:hypothetical protein AB751O23_BN_00080, partial [Chlamydiales bacterium SCGC AB-751-O23]
MLRLLRRHQRALFIFITVFIIISFTFFGTSETQSISYSNDEIGSTLEGNTLFYKDVEVMRSFLKYDLEDQGNSENIFGGNFFNDGVLKEDFFKSGLAAVLITNYQDVFKDSLTGKHKAEKNFTLYQHPYIKTLGTAHIWKDFSPQLLEHYQKLNNTSNPLDSESVNSRIQLYLAEKKFNQDLLKRFIYFEESRNQSKGVPRDAYLMRRDLSLFNYKNIDDWFSDKFLNISAQFIYNVADLAEAKGYSVDSEEVEARILFLAKGNYEKFQSHLEKQEMDLDAYIKIQLTKLGLTHKDLFHVMRKVMLFRALTHDLASSVLDSPFSIESFNSFALEKVQVDRYELGSDTKMNNLKDLVLFEMYSNAVAKESFKGAIKEYKDVKTLKTQAPHLVQKKFKVKVSEISKSFLAARFSIKQTWD